ncbi:MAG: zinc ribbon domain-containing protein [Candidatus Firestonebacteria bacterium]
MPTYEYECPKCGHHFELLQSIKASSVKSCPKCKGKAKRIMSLGAGFIFKGSGFYATEYRSENYKKRSKEEKGEVPKKQDSPKKTDETKSKPALVKTESKTKDT